MPVRIVRRCVWYSAGLPPAPRFRPPYSARLASAVRFGVWLQEVHGLLAAVPDHRGLGGVCAGHHLAASQDELAWGHEADLVDLGPRRERAQVGFAARLEAAALK